MTILATTEHPHVHRDENGAPVIGAAHLPVWVLAQYWRLGWSIDDLAAGYPFLSIAEILDGLSYYHDHQEEVEVLIRANQIHE